MTKDEPVTRMGQLEVDWISIPVLIGAIGGIVYLIIILFGPSVIPLTFYNFETGELTESQVYDYLEDKHEAWFCNFDQTLDRHWCIAGKSNQLKILYIAERNVEIVEK